MGTVKVRVSTEWTAQERADLQAAIETRLSELQTESAELRKTILYEAPCFAENAAKQAQLKELLVALAGSAAFLESSRRNFSEFLTD